MNDQQRLIRIIDNLFDQENFDEYYKVENKFYVEYNDEDNITFLRLIGLDIDQIPAAIFEFEDLHTLIIKGSEATSIENGVKFNQLDNLTTLDLSYNELTHLPEQITDLDNLIELNLSFNPVHSLPQDFSKLTSLRRLYLDNAKLSDIEPIFTLSELHHLKVGMETDCLNIDDDIGNLDKLIHLVISPGVCQIPDVFSNLPLKSLSLYLNHKVTKFPDQLLGISTLTDLLVDAPEINSIPDLDELINLKRVKIIGPKVKSLPRFPHKIEDITINASIEKIPRSISEYQNLIKLNLTENNIQEISDDLYNLDQLTHLHLDKNQITEISTKINQLENLIELTISDNQLEKLPQIANLKKLQKLYVGENGLESLPSSLIVLKQIQELDVGSNRLSSLPFEPTFDQRWMALDDGKREKTKAKLDQANELRWINLTNNDFADDSLTWLSDFKYLETVLIDSENKAALGEDSEDSFPMLILDYEI